MCVCMCLRVCVSVCGDECRMAIPLHYKQFASDFILVGKYFSSSLCDEFYLYKFSHDISCIS